MKKQLGILGLFAVTLGAQACIWDARTMLEEKFRSYNLATTILGDPPKPVDPKPIQDDIKKLEADRHENDPDWWSNLAGSYLRLNQPEAAAKLLEAVVAKFPDNYGIHANLGTAYHLLGRYADAEKEIAHDLEINPDAHFGLEKYHLALLQYLMRDAKYQTRHVYVDELTAVFLATRGGLFRQLLPPIYFEDMAKADFTNGVVEAEQFYSEFSKTNPVENERRAGEFLAEVASLDAQPAYRAKWNLADDPKFEEGIIYMASMNPKEPSCFVMLGLAAWRKHDYHLAAAAFEKAISFGSPQSDLLKIKIAGLKDYASHWSLFESHPLIGIGMIIIAGLAIYLSLKFVFKQILKRYRKTKS